MESLGPWKQKVERLQWPASIKNRAIYNICLYFIQIRNRKTRSSACGVLNCVSGWIMCSGDLLTLSSKMNNVSTSQFYTVLLGILSACLTLSDGLVDCMDPDCCLQATCHTTSLCVGSPDPLDIIQETQLSSTQSKLQTFYERVHFLVGRDSTHVIPGANPFDGKWVVGDTFVCPVLSFIAVISFILQSIRFKFRSSFFKL